VICSRASIRLSFSRQLKNTASATKTLRRPRNTKESRSVHWLGVGCLVSWWPVLFLSGLLDVKKCPKVPVQAVRRGRRRIEVLEICDRGRPRRTTRTGLFKFLTTINSLRP
jgi:hypothetical protein